MMKGYQDKTLLVGNLDSIRVVIDVRDCVLAYYKLMLNDRTNGGIYNVCGETPHKMRHYTELLLKASGLEDVEQKIHEPFWRPIDIHYQNGDSSNLKELTGWEPSISHEETMDDLLKYWVDKIS